MEDGDYREKWNIIYKVSLQLALLCLTSWNFSKYHHTSTLLRADSDATLSYLQISAWEEERKCSEFRLQVFICWLKVVCSLLSLQKCKVCKTLLLVIGKTLLLNYIIQIMQQNSNAPCFWICRYICLLLQKDHWYRKFPMWDNSISERALTAYGYLDPLE